MVKTCLFLAGLFMNSMASGQGTAGRSPVTEDGIPLDSIRLSDPFILADAETQMYYMTGTGGMLWKSKDLAKWQGPYRVTETDPESWMGPRPMICTVIK